MIILKEKRIAEITEALAWAKPAVPLKNISSLFPRGARGYLSISFPSGSHCDMFFDSMVDAGGRVYFESRTPPQEFNLYHGDVSSVEVGTDRNGNVRGLRFGLRKAASLQTTW